MPEKKSVENYLGVDERTRFKNIKESVKENYLKKQISILDKIEEIFSSEASKFIKPTLIVIVIALGLGLFFYGGLSAKPSPYCNDGSLPGECSKIQPFYCDTSKNLVEMASICECPNMTTQQGEKCISNYQTEPKNITLKYTLRGEESEIDFTVYKGLVDYLDSVPLSINYDANNTPARQDFKIRKTYEPQQKALLRPLITQIQKITPDEKDQFRIAVSIVQNIPFGYSNRTEFAFNQEIYHDRYPYEVLYDQQGICGEKSELLGFLLKEMGYDTAIFYFQKENHETVGIKCPTEKSLFNTGYCFIETTGPSIITNNKIVYADGTRINSIPEVMQISKGGELDNNMYEYKDAKKLIKIDEKIINSGRINPLDYFNLQKLKNKYGLADYYRLR